jgi:hypothetical protein
LFQVHTVATTANRSHMGKNGIAKRAALLVLHSSVSHMTAAQGHGPCSLLPIVARHNFALRLIGTTVS